MEIKDIEYEATSYYERKLTIETDMGKAIIHSDGNIEFPDKNFTIEMEMVGTYNILPIIEFIFKNEDSIKKIQKIQRNEYFSTHRQFAISRIYEGIIKDKLDEKIIEIEKFFTKLKKTKSVKEELENKFIDFGEFFKYFKTKIEGKTVIFVGYQGYSKSEDITYVFIVGDNIEMRKTKSYLTIYKMLKENKLNVGRLTQLTQKDIKYLKEKQILNLLKGLLFDLDEETRKKFKTFIAISCLE